MPALAAEPAAQGVQLLWPTALVDVPGEHAVHVASAAVSEPVGPAKPSAHGAPAHVSKSAPDHCPDGQRLELALPGQTLPPAQGRAGGVSTPPTRLQA